MRCRTRSPRRGGTWTASRADIGSKRSTNARLANSKGVFRHPVFADGDLTRKEWAWVDQPVPGAKGWFDKTYINAAPDVRKRIEQVMQETVDEIVAKAKGRGAI